MQFSLVDERDAVEGIGDKTSQTTPATTPVKVKHPKVNWRILYIFNFSQKGLYVLNPCRTP